MSETTEQSETSQNTTKKRGNYNIYKPEQKGFALGILDANNGNVTLTAIETNIAKDTIQSWKDEKGLKKGNDEIQEIRLKTREMYRKEFISALDVQLEQLKDPDKARRSKLSENTFAAATMFDKLSNLDNAPTLTIEVQHKDNLITELVERARQRMLAAESNQEPEKVIEGDCVVREQEETE